MVKMVIGTSFFPTLSAAVTYYEPYGFSRADVREKAESGEISIGKPELQPGERLIYHPGEGRYLIETHKL